MTAEVPLLDIENLEVEFKTREGIVKALRGVSFDIRKGEMLGVVGESGSGKSVTAFTAMGILDPAGRFASGKITFAGLDVGSAEESALREMRGREVSMIFQNPRSALNPIRAVGRQIEDVLREHTTVLKRDVKARAIETLKSVRISNPEERYHAYPYELSGGMCQRVMIAMALACNPQLLIADEPTTGLDVTTQKVIMDLIQELARERDMATLLITHDFGVAAKYCDRLVVMQNGNVVEANDTATLFRAPQHPYTKKLIKATPRPDSKLSDLTVVSDEMDGAGLRAAAAPTPVNDTGTNREILLRVEGLVKEYPLKTVDEASLLSRLLGGAKKDSAAESRPNVFRAVDGIDFEIVKGESVGLVGESGCGKSTTSTIVTRLIDATAGRVIFDGEDIAAIPASKFARDPRRSRIQIVFQDPTDSLNPRFSAFDSIADPLRRLAGMKSGAALSARVEELAQMVGLPTHLLTRFPHQLSGGQKARVGIGRAIALSPDLLILDEPTSALDVSVQAVVLQLLARLRAELGMSYLFVSHDLNVVRLLCDRVIVMNAGKIVETGDTKELLSAPKDPYTRTLIEAIPHFEMR